jgi:hypothetical protein
MLIDKLAELLQFVRFGRYRYRYDKKVAYVSGNIFPEPESTVQILTGNKFRFELDPDDLIAQHCLFLGQKC